jgi:cell division protein FtsZ
MANAKRASMREGPLAALFRKTEEAEGQPSEAPPEPEPVASRPPAHPRETGLPHPALGASTAPPREELRVPSPQERLRHAFSSEIPENVLDRPARRAVAREQSYERPVGASEPTGRPIIRVVGVGGAGVNAVNRMVEAEVEGVEFLAVNTDLQSLQQSTADLTLHIGAELTRGLGSGSDANIGRQAAMEDYDRMKALLKGSDMIFIAAGSGGGTGTGAAPVLARISREVGALTVAIVTKPFGFEGSRRRE